jgi:hypothetical protein
MAALQASPAGDLPPVQASELNHYLYEEGATSVSHGKRSQKEHAATYCRKCYKMLAPRLNSSRQDFRGLYCRIIKVPALETSAKSCSMCDLILSVLRGSGFVLAQAKVYDDDSLNESRYYDQNGVSDYDASIERDRRVRIELRADGRKRWIPSTSLLSWKTLALAFSIRLRTQASAKSSDSEKFEIKEELIVFDTDGMSRKPTYRTEMMITDSLPMYLINSKDPRLENDQKIALIRNWLCHDRISSAITSADEENETNQTSLSPFKLRLARLLILSDESSVRLIDFTESVLDSAVPGGYFPAYVALSHRWGASQHLTTTISTISFLKAGILSKELPRTFRDAIFVTRQLGYNYI